MRNVIVISQWLGDQNLVYEVGLQIIEV